MTKAWNWFLHTSLWLASIGLMIASSGIDGAYLTKLMPARIWWLGLVLNTVADISSEVMMYWYGRLRQAGRKGLGLIVAVQVVLVGYAWLFGWRQLVPIVRELEPIGADWYAGIMAAFIPAALVGIGYVQSLLAGRIVAAKSPTLAAQLAEPAPIERQVAPVLSDDALDLAIIGALSAAEPPTQTALAAELGITRQKVGYRVAKLRAVGRLDGHGEDN